MKHKNFLITVQIAALLIFAGSAAGQFRINLPKMQKLKTTIQQPQADASTSGEASRSSEHGPKTINSAADICSTDPIVKSHLKDLATTRTQAENYRPGLRPYYVQDFSDRQNIYLKASLSLTRRNKWLENWDPKLAKCMQGPLDDLAAVAQKTLPTYHPSFAVRNPVEEKLLKTAVSDIANATIFKIAFEQAAWKIDKDQFNFPTGRYKHGMIWAKYPGYDDGFCRIISINLVQDYAGGGTYGESYAKFIASEFAGCPASK